LGERQSAEATVGYSMNAERNLIEVCQLANQDA
jgi:hypothetical protein